MKELDKKNIEDIVALTPMQEGILYHYLGDTRSDLYFEQLSLEISGEINHQVFEHAWNFVIDTNELLRTVFRWENAENPVQIFLKKHQLQPVYVDFTGKDFDLSEKRAQIEKIKAEKRTERFDLRNVPFQITLCKIQDQTYEMVINFHHILLDGWSTGIVLREFFYAYNELVHRKTPQKPVKSEFKEFVKWLQDRDQKREEKFWTGYLEGFDRPTRLSIKRAKGKSLHGAETLEITIKKNTREQLEKYIHCHRITMAAVLYSAWGILLQKYNNSSDVIFGTTVSVRSAKIKGSEDMVGLFINTLPLRVQSSGTDQAVIILKRINKTLQQRDMYKSTPLVKIREYSRLIYNEALFDTIVVIENYPLDTRTTRGTGPLAIESYSIWEMPHYDLTLGITLSGEIAVRFIYDNDTLAREVIERMAHHFTHILKDIAGNPGMAIGEIDMLGEEEKRHLLEKFSHPGPAYPQDETIHGLFAHQAEKTPHHLAVRGRQMLAVGQKENVFLTYKVLNQKSHQVAHLLRQKGVQSHTIVSLIMERSMEMILGMLGILKAGGAYLPINPKNPESRTQYMLEDSGARIVVTNQPGIRWGTIAQELIYLSPDTMNERSTGNTDPCPASLDNLAYIIYTSGSTGKPKGVPITHANLSPLLHWGYENLGIGSMDRVVQNLFYYFDWSVWEIFIALTSGSCLYLVAEEVLLDAGKYLDFIDRNQITVLHITPTQFQSLLNSVKDGRRLESLKYLCIGAEKLTYDLVRRSYDLVGDRCRVFNMYGPTEATIMAAVLEISRSRGEFYRRLSGMPIGTPIANTWLLVVDGHLNLCPVEVPGELVIAGDSVSGGYLNNPELTAEKFLHVSSRFYRSNRSYMSYIPQKIYQTGDRVRWLADGNCEFLERMDQQVKIRGYRIEPGEIESRLTEHKDIKDAVVMAQEAGGGEKYLCAYIVAKDAGAADNALWRQELREFLSQVLPGYMIPTHFAVLEKMPLNPNGKIDRNALPEPGTWDNSQSHVPPRDMLEKKLTRIWQEVLKTDGIGIYDDFFEVGGHSLNALGLVNAIQKKLHVQINVQDIFQFSTIVRLGDLIRKSMTTSHREIEIQEEREYYELSYWQKRLWFLYQLEPDSPGFNLCGRVTLNEHVEESMIWRTLQRLVVRHESLRTYFRTVEGNPVQVIAPEVPLNLETADLSHLKDNEQEAARTRFVEEESMIPFNLEIAPLFRAKLVKCKKKQLDLVLTMHHIISDGYSVEILAGEFFELYQANQDGGELFLPLLSIRYKDYVYWHHELITDNAVMARAKEFWKSQLEGELSILNLPVDFSRNHLVTKQSAGYRIVISSKLTGQLRIIAREFKATLFMVLLAGFSLLLSRLTGQEDILLGVPGAARHHDDLKNVIGLFVNTLILRHKIEPGQSFASFLEKVQHNMLQALEHQSCPLELICSQDKIKYPEITVFFNMLTFAAAGSRVLEDQASYHIQQVQPAKFDMVCYLTEYQDGIEIVTHYFSELFKPETIVKIMQKYIRILENICEDPRGKGKRLGIQGRNP